MMAFLEAQDPSGMLEMLCDWADRCNPSEQDLLFTRSILL